MIDLSSKKNNSSRYVPNSPEVTSNPSVVQDFELISVSQRNCTFD